MLNEIGVQSVRWTDVSIANKIIIGQEWQALNTDIQKKTYNVYTLICQIASGSLRFSQFSGC